MRGISGSAKANEWWPESLVGSVRGDDRDRALPRVAAAMKKPRLRVAFSF
jgi:hypothetical protein